jgi:1,4-dihydroxy-2-naphthoyl-CoA hydrolase
VPVSSLYDLARTAAGGLVPVPAETAAVPAGCLLDVLGMNLTHVGAARSRAVMRVGPAHLNQRGNPQGGAIVAFADAAAGWASYGALEGGAFTTVQLSTNLLAGSRVGETLVALTEPIHVGRRVLVLDVRIVSAEQEAVDDPRLVARFTCTQLVLER